MTYSEAKKVRDSLEAVVKATGKAVEAFPREGAMNLVTEEVRLSPDYRAAKSAYNRAFFELQTFNRSFVRKFAKELRLERRNRFQGCQPDRHERNN